jgi:hypothetical protein
VPPLFTVLLPITRPPFMLPFAIESVLAQSVLEFELFIICDGAPPETVACARDYACRDTRVEVFPFPKGQRNGEAHRHTVLGGAAGRYVAQIADDDLWFPNHLSELEILLSKADFGNLLHVFVHPDGRVTILPSDIGLPELRQRMLTEEFNLFGPSVAGYRLDAYRRLPEGWSPAPTEVWSDLYMWRKFFRMEGLVFATRAAVTALVFAAPHRVELTLEQRRDENRAYLERVRDSERGSEIVQAAWLSLLHRDLQSERQVFALAAARDSLAIELAGTTRLVAAKEEEINRALQSNGELATELAGTTRLVAAKEEEVNRALQSNGELAAELARRTTMVTAKENEINRILQSRSWRLTAPLRKSLALVRSYRERRMRPRR